MALWGERTVLGYVFPGECLFYPVATGSLVRNVGISRAGGGYNKVNDIISIRRLLYGTYGLVGGNSKFSQYRPIIIL